MLVPSLIKWHVIRNLGLVYYLRQACNIIFENNFDETFVPVYLRSESHALILRPLKAYKLLQAMETRKEDGREKD